MEDQRLKLIIGVTGASGAIYANVLLDRLIRLEAQVSACGVLFSYNAKGVCEHELGNRDF